MTTTVHYHADGYGPARPAINVKDRHSGMDFVIALERLVGDAAVVLGESENCIYPDTLRDIAYERVVSDFWQAAQEIATQRGLGEIAQEGRSGGWLVFTDNRLAALLGPDDMDAEEWAARKGDRLSWLAGYRALSEWADAYIAAAPARVAALAQGLAMDALGEPAANRMFGTERMVTA